MELLLQGHLQPPSIQIRQNSHLVCEQKNKNTSEMLKQHSYGMDS